MPDTSAAKEALLLPAPFFSPLKGTEVKPLGKVTKQVGG